MHNYKLLAFDWDGTLMDSINTIVNSLHLSAKAMRLPACSDQQAKDIIGLKLDEAINILYPNLSSEQIVNFLKYYSASFIQLEKDTARLFPNVEKTLKKLKSQGYLLAVATGKSRKGLNRILNNLQLNYLFDATRCADETAGKPDPMMLNELLHYFNLDATEILMVGDASFDLQMANNANIDAVAVSYGAQSIEILNQYKPVAIIDSFEMLYPWLMDKNRVT